MTHRWRSARVPHPSAPVKMTAEFAGLLRFGARAGGAFSLAAFLFLSLYRGIPRSLEPDDWEIYAQLATLVLIALGYAIAWKWEGAGSALLIVGGTALGIAASISYPPSQAVLAALAFVLPGLAFAAHWQWHAGPIRLAVAAVPVLVVIAAGGWTSARVYDAYYGPTHPSSDTELAPVDLVEWAWSGAVTETGFVVKAKLRDQPEGAVRLLVTALPAEEPVVFDGRPLSPGDSQVWQFQASGLAPGTRYEYAIEADGREDEGRRGRLTTFSNGPLSFTIAAGSCMRTGSDGEVFDRIREANPLFFVVPGDFTYENLHTTDPRDFLDAYSRNLRSAPQEALYLQSPFVYVWDDHDFGGNDSDASSVSRDAARDAYAAYVPHYDLPAGDGNAIYQAFTVGRVRFLLTDTRSERLLDDGPGGRPTMLGAEQLSGLKDELLAARDTHVFTVWVNGVPWIAEASAGGDTWGGFAAEREEIANFIADNGIRNLAMISGDAHMVAIDDGTNSDYATTGDGAGFPVLHAAALDRRGTVKGGPYSEGTYPGGGQFALMDVEDNGDAGITVTWTGMTWEGEQLVSFEFTVGGENAAATR